LTHRLTPSVLQGPAVSVALHNIHVAHIWFTSSRGKHDFGQWWRANETRSTL